MLHDDIARLVNLLGVALVAITLFVAVLRSG